MKGKRSSRGRKIEGILLMLFLLSACAVYAESLTKVPLYINSLEIRVEVATKPEERAQGLMGRKHLAESEGMLFIFEEEDFWSFWMKDTLIPLSIAFIDKEGKIVSITDMKPLTLDSHSPPKRVLYALEMNRGWFSAHGVKTGDLVRFSK